MAISEWNLALNGLILLLMAGYGFWLKHVTTQQDKLKDKTMEALNAVIASKDAEIARLKGESAPEIAKSYRTMKEHSEEMSKKANELERDLEKLKSRLGEKEALLSSKYLGGRVSGLVEAASALIKLQRSWLSSGIDSEASSKMFDRCNDVAMQLLRAARDATVQALAHLEPTR